MCGTKATKFYPQKMSYDTSKHSRKVSDSNFPNYVLPLKTTLRVDSSTFDTLKALRWMKKNIMIQFGSSVVKCYELIISSTFTKLGKSRSVMLPLYFLFVTLSQLLTLLYSITHTLSTYSSFPTPTCMQSTNSQRGDMVGYLASP